MDKKIAGVVGAVAGLATIGGAQAATPAAATEALNVSSYADLLAPIANPVEQLKADNAARSQNLTAERVDALEIAQVYYPSYTYRYPPYVYHHHHHHHHHHHAYRNHHHHHHHNSAFIGVPGIGGVVVGGR